MRKFWIPILLFLAVGGLLAYGLRLDPKKIPSPLIGKPVPAFRLATLEDPGRFVTPEDYKGRAWLLNVWASWCTACREEHPLLMDMAQRGLPIVALNYKDTPAEANGVLAANGNPYLANLVDANGRVGIDLGVYGVPETFVIDAAGIIRYKHIGPITAEALEKEILPRLGTPQPN